MTTWISPSPHKKMNVFKSLSNIYEDTVQNAKGYVIRPKKW